MASSLWAAEGSKSRLSETIFNINNLTSLVLPEGMNKKESSSQRKQKWDVLSFDHMLLFLNTVSSWLFLDYFTLMLRIVER